MDIHSNSNTESGRFEQIVSQFLLKTLHIILDSRVPSIRPDHSSDTSLGTQVKKSDKWFSLVLGDRPAALDNFNFWRRNLTEPMVIDVILVREGSDSLSECNDMGLGKCVETVIERWVVQYEQLRAMHTQVGDASASYKKTYKKSIILLRSLYSMMRLLPAYRPFRKLCSSSQASDFDISYKVSSFSAQFARAEEEMMRQYSFSPVDAPQGRLSISVTYRESLAEFNLETSRSFPPQIIMDYVGSPVTNPLRAFSPSSQGIQGTSIPLRRIQTPSSGPFQRPHSWTSGFQMEALIQNQPLGGSPPVRRFSTVANDYPSALMDVYGHRMQNYNLPTNPKTTNSVDHQLSPPYSPSPSPSSPSYLSGGNPVQSRMRSDTAPVSIPHPMMGRSPRYLSPNLSDSNRHSLPPLSPRSTKLEPSSQNSPSGRRLFRRSESQRSGELNTGIATNNSGLKMLKDSKDESGRFSALLSSSGSPRVGFSGSSGRLSFQDDLDDGDFSCPFIVDDVDTSDSPVSQNFVGHIASEFTSQPFSTTRKSQDAAVGALVHMLRTAAPLRQDSSCYSAHSSKTEPEEEEAAASGFFLPRKTSDALEELKGYREMKDLLLTKNRIQSVSKEAA